MKKSSSLMFGLLVALMLVLALSFSACGDNSSDNDPTDSYPTSGQRDEQRCKDACQKLADCIEELAEGNFLTDCEQRCNQLQYFDYETLLCIESSECDAIMGCSWDY